MPHNLTVEQVKEYYREIGAAGPVRPGEYREYVSPYRERLDGRNYWTAVQDTATIEPPDVGEGIPDVPPVTLYPTSHSTSAAGGSGSFSVTMTGEGQSGSWTVDPEASATWLHLSSPPAHTPQTANGQVIYSADANASGAARAGHFYINGKTFTVDQAA